MLLLLFDGKGVGGRYAFFFFKFLCLVTANEFTLLATAIRTVALLAASKWTGFSVRCDRTGFRSGFNISYLVLWCVNGAFELTGPVVD